MSKKTLIIRGISFIIIGIVLLLMMISKPKLAVLGYHSFTKEKSDDQFVMELDQFEEQLKYLKKHNYKTISLDEAYDIFKNKKKIPRKTVMITFDDGYQSNYDLAFPILKKYKMKAVVFVVGYHAETSKDGYMSLETLNKIKTEYPNVEVASHTYNLHVSGVVGIDKKQLEEDFKKMNDIVDTKYFAYPYGKNDKTTEEVLKDNGYKLAFTFGPGKEHRRAGLEKDLYKIPRLNITNNMPMWKFILRLKYI